MKVALVHKSDAMRSPGGGEVQLLDTAAALERLGVETKVCAVDALHDRLPEVDVFHFFGTVEEFLPAMERVASAGLPSVVSTIAWYDLSAYWHESDRLVGRLGAASRFLARAAFPELPSWRKRLYRTASLLLPNSEAEAEQLRRYFRIESEKIQVVPNGVDPRFGVLPSEESVKHSSALECLHTLLGPDLAKAVLCVGRIEPRKNQLALLRAWRDPEHPLVFIGEPPPEHEGYYQKCCRNAPGKVLFVGPVDHDDPALVQIYAEVACLVLPSRFETPGLVALEAALTGTPLVLTERGCTREYFGDLAEYVSPDDTVGIREAIVRAIARGRHSELIERVLSHFTWDKAAKVTLALYESAVSGSMKDQ